MTDAKPDDEAENADVAHSSDSPESSSDSGARREHETHSPTRSNRGTALGVLALTAALLAVAGTGFLWWQYRQFYVSLADADAATADALERVRATQRASADRLDELGTALRANDQALRELEGRLDVVPGQLADMQRRIDTVQGGTFDARTSWLLAEAEYYLALANSELMLAASWETARAALRLADDRLREIADPALGSIRDLVADEIIALNGVRLVDTEGLAFSLGRLAARAETFPLRAQGPEGFAPSGAGSDESEPGLARLWRSVKGALSSIVRIERRGGDVEMALSDEEARLVRRQLSVELGLARLALVRREQESYAASLASARTLLESDFNVQASEVQNAVALIDELLMLDIAPAFPDISRSLLALRARSGVE